MKKPSTGFPERYALALGRCRGQASAPALRSAQDLGRQALILGLGTLDLARLHERAAAVLGLPRSRSDRFFSQAIGPIAEQGLRQGREAEHQRLLAASRLLQEDLRLLARRVLIAQESERTILSRALRDEVGQGLLGLHVRLHTLRQEAKQSTHGLQLGIASAQRLLVRSARSVRRLTSPSAGPGVGR